MNETNSPFNVLRMKNLTQKLGISRSSIYDKINPKSQRYDSTFPKPIKLGASAVGWVEVEVDEWLKALSK